jgi:exosortase/archaeosortase family protein
MHLDKKTINFIIYFTIIYTLLSFIFLKTIATPLINLWEYLIRSIFGDFLNYEPFIFVPICSGVISISVYLGIITSSKITLNKNSKIKWILLSVLLLWLANFLRILLVLLAEKISLSVSKTAHIVFWFAMGVVILYLILKTLKK